MKFFAVINLFILTMISANAEIPYFPFQKGSVWIYSAKVEWTEDDNSEGIQHIRKKDIIYRVELLDTYKGGNIFMARLHGFITDLAWYTPETKPKDCLLIQVGSNHLHLINEKVDAIWNAIIASKGNKTISELEGDNLLLEIPLTVNAHYGDFPSTSTNMHCWVVESKKSFSSKAVAGAPSLKNTSEFTLSHFTSPDHQILKYVPGLGITRYEYVHHGTSFNTKAELIQYIR